MNVSHNIPCKSLEKQAHQRSQKTQRIHKVNSADYARSAVRRTLLKLTTAVVALLVMFSFGANAQDNTTSTTPPQVQIAGSQELTLSSSITHQDYVLYINLPRGYGDTTKTFPVLYLLDAQWDFSLVQAIYGSQYYDGFVPGIVIVGITWGGKNPDYDKRRAFDLTPTDPGKTGNYGNAPNFLAFIKQELIPFIESKYRVRNDDRALVGSSFGGLFTLYAMFHETGTFNRCILTSPAIGWDNNIISSYNKEYAERSKELRVRLYMGIGGYENVPAFETFVDQLKGEDYTGFALETKVLEGFGHSGAKAEGFSRGLQFVYAKPQVNVDPKVLDQYAGEYEVNPQMRITLERDGDHLVGTATGNQKLKLYAETEKDFHVIGAYLIVHFEKDASGKVSGFQLEQYNAVTFVKKVK
jgi:predicted alpha/beta superfamily hydrolase